MVTLARIQFQPKVVLDLKMASGYYIGYIPDLFADKANNDGAVQLCKVDLSVTHALNNIALPAIGDAVRIKSTSPLLKDLLETMLAGISDFSEARRSLVSNSSLLGLSLQRKFYTEKHLHNFEGEWKCVSRIQEVNKQRLRIERANADKNIMYWTLWSPIHDAYVILEDRADNPSAQDGFAVQDYVWLFNEYEEEYPYFKGLIVPLYPYIYAKSKVFQYWAELCDFCGGPMVGASMDLNRASLNYGAVAGMTTAAERQQALLNMLEDMRARKVFVLGNGDAVKLLESGQMGGMIIKDFMTYVDERIMLLILGAELTTRASHVGSFALGEIHKEQTQNAITFARLRLLESLARDLVKDFLIRNAFRLFARYNIDWRKESVDITAWSEREELKKQALREDLDKKAGKI